MLQNAFFTPVQDISAHLGSDLERGLDKECIPERLQKYGPNQIPEQGTKKRWTIFLQQLMDSIIYILFAAAILAFIFSDKLESAAILFVILISVAIGYFMELKAVRSLEALVKMGQASTHVIRSGQRIHIKAAEIVPGDLIVLSPGDVVPADARLIYVDNLLVKESVLTGESLAVAKVTEPLPMNTPITDQINMVFRGTVISSGFGKAIVTASGKHTQLGTIQQMGVDAEKERTPLEKKLNQLSNWLIGLTLGIAGLIIVIGYFRGNDLFFMIETGVALAVAAIPEGLPIVATIALARGMIRLTKKQVIIKKMEAVQTLGATDIIFTDKTGTLTEDRMMVSAVIFGETYLDNPYQKEKSHYTSLKNKPVFDKMMMAGILCNNVDPTAIIEQADSIELALIHFAIHLGYDPKAVKQDNPENLELPFDSEIKLMATAHKKQGGYTVYAKGAFESLVDLCNFDLYGEGIGFDEHKLLWKQKVDTLASQGLRTLAFAYKEEEKAPSKDNILNGLTFLGTIGFLDPARKDVKAVIDIYKKAGIKVIMVTGDHPGTSKKIAQDVGILEVNDIPDKIWHGKDLNKSLDGADGNDLSLLKASVFARVGPEQKLNLIGYYQRHGHIVGMIGDGINDVPALKKADIGVAMGIRGAEAAREVADVILKNDKFTAMELGIRQGRVIFQNIRQFVVYLLSCNLAEILTVGFAALLNLPAPLLPLQILFLNLVTDIFPALALGFGKGEKDIMEQPPKRPKGPILDRNDWNFVVVYGLSISIAVVGIVAYADRILKLSPETINNMAFYTLVFAQLLNVFNIPKHRESFFVNEITTNLWVWGAIALSLALTLGANLNTHLAAAFSLRMLSLEQLGYSILFAFGALLLAQFFKRARILYFRS
ncbi:cation-transporting P-type ATPase [Arenibacter sp. BSSL-BM3]|uniref:Cation-transporting P-type ATPase n=1 Tax=Arenibacter arenosicollis TaxID=2762274 RepID=A0ABR7QNG9_9FLAO|nr:cation-transporting P-type ATPase [Arenibacter arenosicollis]MBC8768644.1 cation-transporting P-type ATPase [Arenibacter arenosicollis]